MKELQGTYSVTVTPTNSMGKVNYKSLKKYINWQIEQNISGLIILGSTGEFLSIPLEERKKMIIETIKLVENRVPVLVGAGAENTFDSIEISQFAEKYKASGTLIIPPYYSTPTVDELYHHYELISKNSNLPIMVYNNPATSNVDITPPIFKILSEIKNVKYCKESTMDPTRVKDIITLTKNKIKVFGGIMGYESFLNGACGWVSVPSNILPNACNDIFKKIYFEQDFVTAKKIYEQATPVIKLVGGHYYVAATKFLLNCMGFDVGKPLLPRLDLNSEMKKKCKKYINLIKQINENR
jgi:4-hydroxy-tetrahydrodipicolinate synthase